ncbi:hypothetical protein RvVAR0630_pl09110 (plasmid) [Agrobacterium vitis]|nr:hypothetical protein RvVAR0630_pl09110 [Agrobacterium vitis]
MHGTLVDAAEWVNRIDDHKANLIGPSVWKARPDYLFDFRDGQVALDALGHKLDFCAFFELP